MEDRGLKMEDWGGAARSLRLFVAISLPETVKVEIEKAQRQLRDALPGDFVRWTKREQFHLTLNFLGDVAEARVGELIEVLREACRPFSALRLRAERIGFFPDVRFPSVIWAWVHDEKVALVSLQQGIKAKSGNFVMAKSAQPGSTGVVAASSENINPPAGRRRSQEEAFVGHITLGRIQNIKRPQAEALEKLALGMVDTIFGEWTADKVELIRSELLSGGSRYTTLATIPIPEAS
jgi:RNA 2',3'-cyclic 3'-phosphodiesterase